MSPVARSLALVSVCCVVSACTTVYVSAPSSPADAGSDTALLGSSTPDGHVPDAPSDGALTHDTGASPSDASLDSPGGDASPTVDDSGAPDASPTPVCTTTAGQPIACSETLYEGSTPYYSFYCGFEFQFPCSQCPLGFTCEELSGPPDAGGGLIIYGSVTAGSPASIPAGATPLCTTSHGQPIACSSSGDGGSTLYSFYCGTDNNIPCTDCPSGFDCFELSAPPDAGGTILAQGSTSYQ